MATNNPNVPAEQKTAVEASAPGATVVPQQPAQLPAGQAATPSGTVVPGPTGVPVAPTGPVAPAAPLTGVPVDNVRRDRTLFSTADKRDADEAVRQLKAERDEEQKIMKEMADVVESDKDYFEQQAEFAKMFEEREGEDSFRRAARIEREREATLSAGDPTRDPVAKQRKMDMNTVQPGAVADAQKIKDIGAEALKAQDKAQGLKDIKK